MEELPGPSEPNSDFVLKTIHSTYFRCVICKRAFRSEFGVKKHLENNHGIADPSAIHLSLSPPSSEISEGALTFQMWGCTLTIAFWGRPQTCILRVHPHNCILRAPSDLHCEGAPSQLRSEGTLRLTLWGCTLTIAFWGRPQKSHTLMQAQSLSY